MKQFYLSLAALFATLAGHAQYAQNFDTIQTTTANASTTYDKLPQGWGIYEVGSGAAADGRYLVADGSNTTGTAYSFGATGSTDRALGTIASNNNFPTLGAIFFNETDNPITSITITYTGEQWRFGGRTTGTKDILQFEYSLDATGIVNNVGTWIRVTQLDFESVITATPTNSGVALNGNLAANRQVITHTITGLNLQPGGSIVIRWSDPNITGNDDGLAVDDFSISAGLVPGVMTSGGTTVGGGTGDGGSTTNNNSTSVPVFPVKLQTDSSFLHLYGNLHGHTTHSDGRASTGQPVDAYTFARNAIGMDFLGISEHNHSGAGMQLSDYKAGSAQADAQNGQPNRLGQPFITLHGMEWGTISSGGHVLVYGFGNNLVNWEAGNFDIFVERADYMTLFDKVRKQPGAFATLAHPNNGDYTGLTGGYKGVADSAVVSVAVESGPAFSTSTSYNDYPSSLAYMAYYRNLLKQGYRIGAQMDQDNHEMSFGTANQNRLVVLSADRTREGLVRGIQAMRIYATNDYNAQVSFSINNYILGSSIVNPSNLSGTVVHTDLDGDGVTAIQLYGGKVRGGDAALIQAGTTSTLNFTTAQAEGETWYYYAVITQSDGGKIVTSPIWFTRATAAPLPVQLVSFQANLNAQKQVTLNWSTASEQNSDHYVVERSSNNLSFESIGKVDAKGVASAYSLLDRAPLPGVNYYRLRQVDKDGRYVHSSTLKVEVNKAFTVTLSPNPSQGLVTVKRSVDTKVLVQVVDIAGNRVYLKEHVGAQFTFDLSNQPSGFYLVRIGDELQQLVIQK